MQHHARTTVASFHYAGALYPVFQSLAELLHQDLASGADEQVSQVWSNERFVSFELGTAQIALTYHLRDTADVQGHRAAITLAVSTADDASANAPRRGICLMLAERIGAAAPAGAEIWCECDSFAPADAADVLSTLLGVAVDHDPLPELFPTGAIGRPLGDIVAAARARVDLTARPRRPARPAVLRERPPILAPQPPQCRQEEIAELRDALQGALNLPLPMSHRVALYSMNLTLCIAAAPVGFALLAYNALGREDLRSTARVVSITGGALMMAESVSMGILQVI